MKTYVNFVIKYQITLRIIMFIITLFVLLYMFNNSDSTKQNPPSIPTTSTYEEIPGFLPNSIHISYEKN